MPLIQSYEYADRTGLRQCDVTLDVSAPTPWFSDQVDFDSAVAVSVMQAVFPRSYADPDSGHTPELITRAVNKLDRHAYAKQLSWGLQIGQVGLLTGTAALSTFGGQNVDLKRGFIKTHNQPEEFIEDLGSVVEIAELAVEDDNRKIHLGSALLFTAMKSLAEDDDPEIVGRIPEFCERSVRLATDSLGMTVVREDEGILFPHNRPFVGKLAKTIGRPLVRPVRWDVYGGVTASQICERLASVHPWLEDDRTTA